MGIDINAEDFQQAFDISKAEVGQIGYGFIGNAVVELFRPFCNVVVYDKAGYEGRESKERVTLANNVDLVVSSADVIFVAVPTPMRKSGECDTRIVESVLQDIQNSAVKIGRNLRSFIVVIKSTVPPGFTDRMRERFSLRIMFSPEFLTEANAVEDFKNANRVILGGNMEDAVVVHRFFSAVWDDRGPGTNHPAGEVTIVRCESTVAEMVKLSTNVHLTSRVMISNELFLICEKLGVDYEAVKTLTQLDRRIGTSHMNVPGPDGHLGYGGHCFVKDTLNLAHVANEIGTADGQTSLFHQLHLRNLEIRDDRDWEEQRGRAVSDD